MKLKNEFTFKSLVYNINKYGSLKVEVRAEYEVEHNITQYQVKKLNIEAVFADEHIDPNINIVAEIGKKNLDELLDVAYEKLAYEMDNVNQEEMKET